VTCERRELLHAHQKAVAAHTAATNSLKDYLNAFAIRLGSRGLQREGTREWILAQRDWSPLQKELLGGYYDNLKHQAEARERFLGLISAQICAEPLMLRCMKLLGIGKINAFALLAVIGEVRRFDRPEKLVAYIGLNPGQRQSGKGKNIRLGVGKRGRGDMRHLLIQSAQAVMRMGGNTTLGKWGWKLFARKGNRNTAVVAVARKLLVQIWHLLSGNPPVALEADKSLTLKLQRLVGGLGKSLREEIGLSGSLNECVLELQRRLLSSPPTAPQ
jgi:transposase